MILAPLLAMIYIHYVLCVKLKKVEKYSLKYCTVELLSRKLLN